MCGGIWGRDGCRRKELMERMERMLDALGNLVDNAIKYTESGSVRVSVTE